MNNDIPREDGVELSAKARMIVERATVHLTGKGGLGVRVGGDASHGTGIILTAAHCIEYDTSGGMTLGDYCLERATTHEKKEIVTQVCAVEPVSDIAVLGEPDGQELYDEAVAFEEFCEGIHPVPISTAEPELFKHFPIFVFTHHRTWIKGTAQLCRKDAPNLVIKAMIEAGTSGGAVVDELGNLMAIVSQSQDPPSLGSTGSGPRPHRALPVWVWDEITASS